MAKTRVLNFREARIQFEIDKHRQFDRLQNRKRKLNQNEIKSLIQEFKKHLKSKSTAHHDKITKRFLTVFRNAGTQEVFRYLPDIFSEQPGMRSSIEYFFQNVGYSRLAAKIINQILDKTQMIDDVTPVGLAKLLINWNIPADQYGKNLIRSAIKKFDFKNEAFVFYANLIIRTKYDSTTDLSNFLHRFSNLWQQHAFLRRQVCFSAGRLLVDHELHGKAINLLKKQQIAGMTEVSSASSYMLFLANASAVPVTIKGRLTAYEKPGKPYRISNFLQACALLSSDKISKNNEFRESLSGAIKDPYYRRWLGLD